MHTAARLDTLGTEQAYVVLAAARRLERVRSGEHPRLGIARARVNHLGRGQLPTDYAQRGELR